MSSMPAVFENETRIFSFPMFDFNGKVSGALNAQQDEQLKFPGDGNWWVWGINATMCQEAAGGLADNSIIGINIFDPTLSQFWFTGGSQAANVSVPLRLTAGKVGNQHFFNYPKLIKAGTQLVLYAMQLSGATPSGRSPLYVSLPATLALN